MRVWIVALVIVVAVMGLGFVHPFGDPRVEPRKGLGTLLQGAKMPMDAKVVLVTKCADCHSSETRWPVYARVAPGSWLIERDIIDARKKMNLSQWEQMPEEKQQLLMAKIVEEAKTGDMPPLQYLAVHWDAKLSKADLQALSMLGKTAGGGEAALGGAGDAVRGKAVFEKRCTGCHAMEVGSRRTEAEGSVWKKSWECGGVYLFCGVEELRVDVE